MSRHFAVAWIALTLTSATTEAVRPDEAADAAWAKKWVQKSKEFATQRDQARAVVVARFDAAIAAVDSQKTLTPAARTDRRKELQAGKETFEKTGAFPRDDDFVAAQFDYALKVNKAALPLATLIDEVIEEGAKTKDVSLEKQGLKMKQDLETQLGGASRLVAGSQWHGELRHAGGGTIPYHLSVGKMGDGGLFKGHVEDNPGVAGNWSYNVEGQTRALGVEYKMSKSVRGNFSSVYVNGIVSGDRLIAKVKQAAGKGKPTTSTVVLRRVK